MENELIFPQQPAQQQPQQQEQPLTYTAAVTELEQLIALMQAPECSIDKLSQYTRRSKELLDFCRKRLTETDTELKQILADMEQQG